MTVPRTPAARAYLKATDVLTSYRCGAIHERDAVDMLVECGQSRIAAQQCVADNRAEHERNVSLKRARAL